MTLIYMQDRRSCIYIAETLKSTKGKIINSKIYKY